MRARWSSREGGAGDGPSSMEPEKGVAGMFFVIGSVVMLSFLIPMILTGGSGGGADGRTRPIKNKSKAGEEKKTSPP